VTKDRIAVAMSGGVDSSVAAALLSNQGHDVFGLMLRLWSEPGQSSSGQNRCCSPASVSRARQVAAILDIPFYVIDARKEFHKDVVEFFIDKYSSGVTPNPCLECNRNVRWGHLMSKALSMGATHIATGHYARINKNEGKWQLLRGCDNNEIRSLANDFGLPVAQRQDSQDLCFLADKDYRRFMQEYAPQSLKPGPIMNSNGETLGQHKGLPLYTIGQRKGIGVSAPEPLYVLSKNRSDNTLIVEKRSKLGKKYLKAKKVNWISGNSTQNKIRAGVQIRYTAKAVSAWIIPINNNEVEVEFDHQINDIAPGQAAVFYQDSVCLGGGIID